MCTLNRAIISNNLLHIYTCVIRGQKKIIYIYIYTHKSSQIAPQTPPSFKSPPYRPPGGGSDPVGKHCTTPTNCIKYEKNKFKRVQHHQLDGINYFLHAIKNS